MIVRSIRVSGWRCFADAVAVGPFQEGLNVIHAPNASGKSTLFEALRLGLMDGHRVRSREAEALRPWGRALTPMVTIEFRHGGREYRITKRFLDSPTSRLERQEDGRFVALAESDKADEYVRALLSRNAPGRGLSRPENWGLAQVLWTTQGDLALKGLSGDLAEDVRSSLGAQIGGAAAGPIERRVEEAYLRLYTPGGKLRSGKDAPPVVQRRDELQAAAEARAGAAARQRQYEEAAARVEDLKAARAQARHDAEVVAGELREARARADVFQKLTSEKARREEGARAEEARHSELKGRMEAIAAIRKEIRDSAAALRGIEADLPAHQRELQQREQEAAAARSALEDVRKERPAVDARGELAEQARQFSDGARTLSDLDRLLGSIAAAELTLGSLRRERTELLAPDDKTLKAIRSAMRRRDEAHLMIESSLITLEVVPVTGGKLLVVVGEEPGEVGLTPGVPARVTGSPEVVADLPGVARLRVSGPAGSAVEHRARRAKAEQEVRRLAEPFGTADVDSLEALQEKGRALDRRIADVEAQIKAWLSGRALDDLQRQRSELQAVRAAVVEARPDWRKETPDPSALKLAADDARRAFVARVEKAESAWDGAQNALTAARGRSKQLGFRAGATRDLTRSLESRLAEVAGDGRSDEQRADDLKKITLSWDAARLKLEEITDRLRAFADNPADTVARLERQLNAAAEADGQARDAEKREEGRLQTLGADGAYSLLAEAEEKEAALQAEVAAGELQAAAVRLLRDTLRKCHDDAVAAVSGPVESLATHIAHQIGGRRLGSLKLGAAFEPAGVVPEAGREGVSLEAVSGGELEQIHLATRLALAEVLARDERQMVVLDDVMTCTDAGRMARVLAVLEEEAQRLQIVILTCHPERYRGLAGARFVDLDTLNGR